MTIEAFQYLSCSLLVHSGPFSDLGRFEMLVSIDALGMEVPQYRDQARVAVVKRQRSGQIIEAHVRPNPLAIARLVSALRTVDFPARTPRLESVVSTGDDWERLRLHVTLDQENAAFELYMEADGFKGDGASQWRTVFHSILGAAGQLESVVPIWARIE